ncbi:MAG TPA: LysM domain-containing protein [Candidatus Udaeobacter sp.]|nr:LysM domain-containing protein [Candidatus Udaeobacter sp.]
MKIPRLFKSKKFMAATARRAPSASTGMDFDGIPEPNMKLSRALLVVLLLHIVAVSGIVAFNAIKTGENSFMPASPAQTEPGKTAETANHAHQSSTPRAAAEKENTRHTELKSSPVTPKQERPTPPLSSGKTYVVKKGDNPLVIAKKLKIPYDDLMLLNHIEDARKLRIGQKLLIPKTPIPKADKKKKT